MIVTKEEWREVVGYGGFYEVSNLGNIRSVDRYIPRGNHRVFKKGAPKGDNDNGNGYRYLILYKEGLHKNHYVHRLVADAFIPNPDNHKYVGHKDHDKANNHAGNLYWTDASTNTRHGIEDGKINYKGRLKGDMQFHSDQVLCSAYVNVKLGAQVQATADVYGINRTTLSSWINKRSRQELTDLLDAELEEIRILKETLYEKHEN